jgi:dihydroorotase
VTPHHLYFDETVLTDANRTWLQMNPPLRGREDRLALIEALRAGLIDYIATDHAPHSIEENAKGISGVPLLDTYGAFATWLMAEHGFTAREIARVCACNPGRFVQEFLPEKLGKGFGVVEEGYAGALTILDMQKPWTVKREEIKSKCGWSPFEGHTFPGSVRYTVVNGKVYEAS